MKILRQILLFALTITICYGQTDCNIPNSGVISEQGKSFQIPFYLLDSSDYENNFFLASGINSQQINPELKVKIFEHFYNKGVRIFVLSWPVQLELSINRFLQTGDTDLIYNFGEGYQVFLEALYKFYSSLPINDKFIIRTLEISFESTKYFRDMYYLIALGDNLPVQLQYIYDILDKNKDKGTYRNPYEMGDDPKVIKQTIIKSLHNNEQLYKDYLKDNYDTFVRIIKADSLGCSLDSLSGKVDNSEEIWLHTNEDFIAQQIERFIEQDPKIKLFIESTVYESYQNIFDFKKPYSKLNSFVYQLKDKDSLRYQICTIHFNVSEPTYAVNKILSDSTQARLNNAWFKDSDRIEIIKTKDCNYLSSFKAEMDYMVIIPDKYKYQNKSVQIGRFRRR